MKIDRLKVLIVEDQQKARMTLRHMLAEIGINQIFEAQDGKEARNFMEVGHSLVDLVICDWNMPNATGLDLFRYISEHKKYLSFLMVTGRSDMDSIMEARNAGIRAYIRKPFSLGDLEQKIFRLIQ